MKRNSHASLVETVKGKVIFTFLLILLSLIVMWTVNRVAFQKITAIVKEFSIPNQKLILSRSIVRDVSNLTHLQRIEVLSGNRNPSISYLNESNRIEQNIQSLRKLLIADTIQVSRIDSINSLLRLHHKLFLDYLRLRFNIIQKREFDQQLKSLTEEVENKKIQVDTNVVTSKERVKTTSVLNTTSSNVPTQKRSWIRSLFHKSPQQPIAVTEQPKITVEEEFNTETDTLAFVNHDSLLASIGSSLKNIESGREQRRDQLRWGEQELLQANEILLRQLLIILDDVEKQEAVKVQTKTEVMVLLATKTIALTKIITILFIIIALILGLFILIDITRSRRYRKQLEMAKSEAEYHSLAKQRFLANMSHEIRTPLQSIIGYAEQLLQQDGSISTNAKAIHQSSEYLLQIVNEVLDYSRITSGKFTVEDKPFDIQQVINEVFSILALQAKKKLLECHLDIAGIEKDLYVKGDSFRLKQILYNVLGNAIKFTEEGSVTLTVKGTSEGGQLNLVFIIEDTGIGIFSEDLEHIFNQFEQAQRTSNKTQTGSGLGLSIAKELVEIQQGKISVQSEFGKGATFIIAISYPCTDKTLAIIAVPEIDRNPFEGIVWIIDDDRLILRLCSIILEKHHIEYKCFNTATAALNEIWDENVKVILMDMRLPDMSSTELISTLRKKFFKNVKIIACTAQVLNENQNSILDNGFDGLLVKPFKESALINTLTDILGEEQSKITFDFSTLENMVGDKIQMREILKQCHIDTSNDIKELIHLVSIADIFFISLIIHRLAGRVAQIGEKKLAIRLHKGELILSKNENIQIVKEETENLLLLLNNFIQELEKQIVLFS